MRLALLALLLTACAAPGSRPPAPRSARFDYVGIHFLVVDVRVNDQVDARFVLDTGIGVNLISQALCDQIGCRIDGKTSGKRMSGQEVGFPLTTLGSLRFAGHRATSARAGVMDFAANNFGIDPSISGFLSLDFFRTLPFSIDYRTRTITLDDEAELARRRARGVVSELRLDEEDVAIDVFTPMRIGKLELGWIEIDTGSPALTLDERYMDALGIGKTKPEVTERSSTDETGYAYTRYFAAAPVPIGIASGGPALQRPVKTMFQKIIHDGLIGDAYLKQFLVSFDLPRRELILVTP